MIEALIFSKDRACQLDLLLRSLERYAMFFLPHVLWSASDGSDDDYRRGYERVFDEYHRNVLWQKQGSSFEDDVRAWLEQASQRIAFLVDDQFFFRRAELPGWRLPFTYRLEQTVFDWTKEPADSEPGYPLALDGTVYEKTTLEPLLADFHFDGPTQLEAGLAERRYRFTPRALYSRGRCTLECPWNRVSEASGNAYSLAHGMQAAALNDAYLGGRRLDLDALSASARASSGAHVVLPLALAN